VGKVLGYPPRTTDIAQPLDFIFHEPARAIFLNSIFLPDLSTGRIGLQHRFMQPVDGPANVAFLVHFGIKRDSLDVKSDMCLPSNGGSGRRAPVSELRRLSFRRPLQRGVRPRQRRQWTPSIQEPAPAFSRPGERVDSTGTT